MTGTPFASARRAPKRWPRRLTAFLVAFLVVAGVVWALVMGALWGYAWFQLGGLDLSATDDEVSPLGSVAAQAPPGTTTVLVALTGARDPIDPDEPELAAPVAIVQVGGGREVPAVLLLPTELPVTVEGLGTVPLSEVHAEGGQELLARAVIDYAELRLDHVVSLTVDALPRLVAAFGGVEDCGARGCTAISAEQLRAAQAEEDPEGLVRALAGALRGLGAELDTGRVVRSPLAAKRAVDAVADEVRTDVSLRGTALLDLADDLEGADPPEIEQIPLFRNPDTGSLVPLEEPVMVRFQRLRDGTPLVQDGDDLSVEDMVTEKVEIAVLNGAGIDGLAADVQARLEAAGFQVVGTGNAPTFDRETTVVAYGPEPPTTEAAAVVLAEELDGARLEALETQPAFEGDAVDIVVTVGEDLDPGDG